MSIKIENVVLPSVGQWEAIIRGMRNPLNSWEKSDTDWLYIDDKDDTPSDYLDHIEGDDMYYCLGQNDLNLMKKLCKAGTEHRKFMRMNTVYMDITAPLYWWKEFDTYKVGTVTNSCSTMHKIAANGFTFEDFSCEHLITRSDDSWNWDIAAGPEAVSAPIDILNITIDALNTYREQYLKTKDKKYWWQMIQLLPSSYNQKRTVMLNYEVLAAIYRQRKSHKLDEWREFCSWIEILPYANLITGDDGMYLSPMLDPKYKNTKGEK